MQRVNQVSDALGLRALYALSLVDQHQVPPVAVIASKVDDLLEDVLNCEQVLEGCELYLSR